jgi:hypothetical protein
LAGKIYIFFIGDLARMFSLLGIYNSDIGVNAVIVRLILRLIDVF